MAVRDFTFGDPGDRFDQGNHTIYFRSSWGDPWVEVGNEYHCLECSFSVAPTMPTAMIQFAYGSIFEIAGGAVAERLKATAKARTGQFVKIVISCRNDGEAVWYGRVDNIDDRHRGIRNQAGGENSVASGVLNLTCYGLEKMLADTAIRHAFTDEQGNGFRIEYAPTFNGVPGTKGIEANRSENALIGTAHAFASRPNTNKGFWSSIKIVDYLLRFHPPLNDIGIPVIPIALSRARSAAGVPVDWDRPAISMKNQSVYTLLNQVIDRRRLQVWHLEVEELGGQTDRVWLVVDTLTDQDIPIPLKNADPIGEATEQVRLKNIGVDPLTQIAIRKSSITLYDQIAVIGARSRHVGTFAYVDGTLEDGWTPSAEADYEQAASNAGDYVTQSRAEKQRRNDRARRLPAVRDVYASFRIPDDWDFRVDNGQGSGTTNHMFPDELGLDNDQWICELFIDRTLPLLTSVDYSGSVIADNGIDVSANNNGEELRPLVFLLRPDRSKKDIADARAARWIRAEDVGAAAQAEPAGPERDKLNDRFSLFIEVPPNSRVVRVKVNGAPQHVIAHGQFNPLADDGHVGNFDFATGMCLTISMRSHLPILELEPEFPAATDVVRTKILNAGDQYRQDYVAPNTVVGIDPDDGQLLRSTGGWIPAVGSDNDPRPRLKAIAKIAAKWYTEQHYVAVINTFAPLGEEDLRIGDMITEVEDDISAIVSGHYEAIYSTVTEIKFSIPRGDGRQAAEMLQTVTTWAGELDTVGIQPFIPSSPAAGAQRGFPDRAAGPQPFLGDLMEIGPDGVARVRPGAEQEAERRRQALQDQLERGDPFAGKRPL